jgi:hypothetical protein
MHSGEVGFAATVGNAGPDFELKSTEAGGHFITDCREYRCWFG